MTTEPVRKRINLEVKSAAPVEGNYGPQWELAIQWPWSQYPSKAWIDRDVDGPTLQSDTYTCVVERGELKDAQKGTAEWNYKWKIIDFETNVTSISTVSIPEDKPGIIDTTAPEYRDPTRVSIERQVCLKAAVELAAANGESTDHIITNAQVFYNWLSQAPSESNEKPALPRAGDDEPHPAEYGG